MQPFKLLIFLLTFPILTACYKVKSTENEWNRIPENPIYRDLIPSENYEVASDSHIFYDESKVLTMIYSGDVNGHSSIKMARGTSLKEWEPVGPVLDKVGPSGLDVHKETSFYRKSSSGKHQIYYIGYKDDGYEAEIYLAEADDLQGPYIQMSEPVISKGMIAGKSVYCITSPSVMEYEDKLYIAFIGWNAHPGNVTEVWVIGAESVDDGHTWTNFKLVDTPIGMEGQVTKNKTGKFIAVSTGSHGNREAIFYSTADHPFGPWNTLEEPILIQDKTELEKDEVIAPQIFIDEETEKEYLYYTGADHNKGWWIMLAHD